MADIAEKRMTVAEFLTWDDGTDTRYELIDGRPVAMAPVDAEPLGDRGESQPRAQVEAQGALLRRTVRPASRAPTGTIRSMRPISSSAARPLAPGIAAIPTPSW